MLPKGCLTLPLVLVQVCNVLAGFVVNSAGHYVGFLILAAIDFHSINKFVDTSWVTVLVYR